MSKESLDQITRIEADNIVFRNVVEQGGLKNLPTYLDETGLSGGKAFIITDSNVGPLYADELAADLSDAGIDSAAITIPAGETSKTMGQVEQVIEELSTQKATRKDTIIALGGGVVGDLGGFVASIYNRGIALVQAPTSLLAMVDASIGGKTGVDLGGKNKTGTFYQPQLIVADPQVLQTLDERVYTEGLGEVAKYGILDAEFLDELELNASTVATFNPDKLSELSHMIGRCVEQKIDIVKKDPFEEKPDVRIILNYGHTLAHGLEAASGYDELYHGEAVTIGMNYVAALAAHLGLTDQSFVERQRELIRSLNLPIMYTGKARVVDVMENIEKDKKNDQPGAVKFVLPRGPGDVVIQQVPIETVRETVERFLDIG